MNARIVVTVTAKVYLGSDLDLTGTTAPGPRRHPETTQQVTLVEVYGRAELGHIVLSVSELADRAHLAVGMACRDAVAKHFKP